MRSRLVAAVSAFLATVFLALGSAGAAFAGTPDDEAAEPVLAQTGYDFTPMLVTAAIVLLIAGVTVVLAKFFLARSSHS